MIMKVHASETTDAAPVSPLSGADFDAQRTRAVVDGVAIAELRALSVIDQAVIAQLEANGIVDRAKIANLEAALVTARRIGAAMGIIMAVQKVTEDQAFEVLRQASQHTNRKLRAIADDVILTGSVSHSA